MELHKKYGSELMKVDIRTQEHNPLLKRIEITFEVKHDKRMGTPQRFEVRKRLAKILKKDLELVYVKRMETKTGTMITFGNANIYDSIEQGKLVEPKHILTRNAPIEKEKEKSE